MPEQVYEVNPLATMSTPVFIGPLASCTWSYIPEHVARDVPPVTSDGQAYYWTQIWQEGERESLAELAAGRGRIFHSPEEAIRYLLSTDDD
jgi:hypothetical protein